MALQKRLGKVTQTTLVIDNVNIVHYHRARSMKIGDGRWREVRAGPAYVGLRRGKRVQEHYENERH
jgi:hypothetical protein